MNTTDRDYDEALGDFGRLAEFVVANNHAVRMYSTWCLGRLVDWRYAVYPEKGPIEGFCAANGHLWFDGFGGLAAFALSESGGAECALIAAEGYRFLFEEMLRWALGRWAGRSKASKTPFSIEITAAQEMEAQVLERAGFRWAATFYTEWFDLTQPLLPRCSLPVGFSIVDMASHPDYRGQRILRSEGFHEVVPSGEGLDRELAWHLEGLRSPIYHAPTDICVMASDGALVAGCEALIDARNCEADIERVCTRSAFRRRGLARAAIQECLCRLQAMGLHRAAITGYSQAAIALYSSLGAQRESASYIYELVPDGEMTPAL